jgi:hypothetical protein
LPWIILLDRQEKDYPDLTKVRHAGGPIKMLIPWSH